MRLQIPRRTKNKKVPPAWKQKRQPSVFFPPHLIFAHGLELCGEGVCVLGVAQQGPPLLQALVQHRRLQLLVVLVEPCTIKDNTLISKKKPWPIGFLDIISGRYINKVNLLRCFYIVHRKNRERKQPQHPVSYCPTVNDDYFRLCGIPGSLLLTRKYCCHNKNGGIRVFLRGLLVNGEMVGYTILYSSLMM